MMGELIYMMNQSISLRDKHLFNIWLEPGQQISLATDCVAAFEVDIDIDSGQQQPLLVVLKKREGRTQVIDILDGQLDLLTGVAGVARAVEVNEGHKIKRVMFSFFNVPRIISGKIRFDNK